MKIAYLVNQYPAVSHTFIRRELMALEQRGFDVTRVTIRNPPAELPDPLDRAERDRTVGILSRGPVRLVTDVARVASTRPVRFVRTLFQAWRWGWRSHRGPLRHIAYFVEACSLTLVLQRLGIEHVHVHFGTNPAMVALLARRLGSPPYSLMIHGPDEFDHPELLHIREKVADSAFIATITDFAKSQVFRWSDPADWSKVHVVRCGLDEQFLGGEPTPVPDSKQFVFVGRLGPAKGHMILLEAAERLRANGEDFTVFFAGDGPMRELLDREVARRGLESTIVFGGWMAGDAVRDAVLASRALILPSFSEGLPVVIMEAFALARPVISTRIAGIPELIDDSNGWVITSGSVDALVTAMTDALRRPLDELSAMGEAGRRAVLDRHDVRKEAAKLAGLLDGSAAT